MPLPKPGCYQSNSVEVGSALGGFYKGYASVTLTTDSNLLFVLSLTTTVPGYIGGGTEQTESYTGFFVRQKGEEWFFQANEELVDDLKNTVRKRGGFGSTIALQGFVPRPTKNCLDMIGELTYEGDDRRRHVFTFKVDKGKWLTEAETQDALRRRDRARSHADCEHGSTTSSGAVRVHQEGAPASGSDERVHVMLSGRFNLPAKTTFIRDVRDHLKGLGVPVYMVEAGPGEQYGPQTDYGLYHMKAMVAFCHEDYGEKTTGTYETYKELKYAYERHIPIFAARLCDQWPPAPRDCIDGRAQNDMIFSPDLLYTDARQMSTEDLARRIAAMWHDLP